MINRKTVDRSAIIMSGGQSKRFGRNKGLVELLGKPLIRYVVDRIFPIVDEIIIVVAFEEQERELSNLFSTPIRIVIDDYSFRSPLVGALTGFKSAHGVYSLLLPCDTPLISRRVITHLFQLASGLDAVIPKWPNNDIEPLQALYKTKTAYESSMNAVKEGKMRMSDMIMRLNEIYYVSTEFLRNLDPELNTFINVNTPQDLKKVEKVLNQER